MATMEFSYFNGMLQQVVVPKYCMSKIDQLIIKLALYLNHTLCPSTNSITGADLGGGGGAHLVSHEPSIFGRLSL